MDSVVAYMRQYLKLLTKILCVVILSVGAFYWWEWRPMSIRKVCVQEEMEFIKNAEQKTEVVENSLDEVVYKICIRKHGLE